MLFIVISWPTQTTIVLLKSMFRAEKSLPGLAKNNFKQSQNLDDTKAVFFFPEAVWLI